MYNAYITRIKNMHRHPNADRLQIGECFGNAVIVSMEYEDNQLGIYFPSDGQLSVEFAEVNNLLYRLCALLSPILTTHYHNCVPCPHDKLLEQKLHLIYCADTRQRDFTV